MRKGLLKALFYLDLPIIIFVILGFLRGAFEPPTFSGVANIIRIISGIILLYSIYRLLMVFFFNIYPPKLPLPKNKILRFLVLFSIGIVIAIVSDVVTLFVWAGVTIISMCMHTYKS